MPERWLEEPPPQSRKRTSETKVAYTTLEGWIEGYEKVSGYRGRQWWTARENQVRELPPSYIQKCTDLGTLEKAVKIVKGHCPARGERAGHFSTLILQEINNRIFKLKQEKKL